MPWAEGNSPVDILGHDSAFPGTSQRAAIASIRLKVSNNEVSVVEIDSDGSSSEKCKANLGVHGKGDVNVVPNVRKPWIVQVAATGVSVNINGEQVIDDCQFEKVHNSIFDYFFSV